jgi:non-specific serine/threonine protein kinase/serine/threonine-protein kinase
MTEDEGSSSTPTGELATEELTDDSRAAEGPAGSRRPRSTGPAPEVADYRLLDRVGSGGMGDVYVAEQLKPIRRTVALKVVKPGMDSREVLARFESERQALALMNHANIAKVYDAGTTEQGRPFFAMEYVGGEPITGYCDRHRLGIRERLELVARVCEGVQHAHQKGIIHRDLKPSNVLVTVEDEEVVPKIIDFGVAKATSQRLTDRTLHTSLGVLIGTPEYMSPEQAEMTGLDVDTRTDVYSLGVLLYELLVGALPFGSRELRQSGLGQIQRTIREVEPARPSTRITELGDEGAEAARRRNHQLPMLARQLRGDLDWITLKAMDKDRTRRYQTASALAMDIRRYLADEPVLASPPSALYRGRKFVRRHRGGVVAAAFVALALVVGTIGTTTGWLRALSAERLASEEAETARRVTDFLVDLYRVADPNEAQGDTVTARGLLDEGARRISRGLSGQPLTQARLMDTMGTVYQYLGLYEESRALLETALEIRESLLEPTSLEVADSLNHLAELDLAQGRYDEGLELAERSLTIREGELGSEDLAVAKSLITFARCLAGQSRHQDAQPHFRRALAIREAALDPEHPDVADSRRYLGISHWRRGNSDAAIRLLRQALTTYETTLGPNDYRIRETLNDLGVLYLRAGRLADARQLLERTIAIKERVVGPEHPSVGESLNNLAFVLDQEGYPEAAEPLWRRALEILEKSLGSEHDRTAMAVANLAWVRYRQGEYADAEPLYRRALGIYERTVGHNNTGVAILFGDQARLFIDQQKYVEAERALRRSAEIWEVTSGSDHPRLAASLVALAELYVDQDKLDEAAPLYERALAIRNGRLGADHAATTGTAAAYAELLRRLGRAADAEAVEAGLAG